MTGQVLTAVRDLLGTGTNYRPYHRDALTALPRHGLTVASTFSGIGGSSFGYRLAGYTVTFAAEFIPAAVDAYRANQSPGTYLHTGDVRNLTGEELVDRAGGVPDILDGSPPCSAFSTLGKGADKWGRTEVYSDGVRQRVDDLLFEFSRLVAEVRPRAFVMENVPQLAVNGVARGYFQQLMAAFADAGYNAVATVIEADRLGAPTTRRRLIILGVRDADPPPIVPDPAPRVPWSTVTEFRWYKSARPDPAWAPRPIVQLDTSRGLPTVTTAGLSEVPDTYIATPDDPNPGLVPAPDLRRVLGPTARRIGIGDLLPAAGFPIDTIQTGSPSQMWERIGRAVPPPAMARIAATLADRRLL